jgi:hypothetical protein
VLLIAGKVKAALESAHGLLKRVTSTGPLMSLLNATWVRHEFLQINRDLSNTFSIFTAGEQLLVCSQISCRAYAFFQFDLEAHVQGVAEGSLQRYLL